MQNAKCKMQNDGSRSEAETGKRSRIWEIDALRGFLILCVIASHALYFTSSMKSVIKVPEFIRFVMNYGGVLFVILSGLSATLGSRSFHRGLLVFAGGMVLTLGSYAAVALGMMGKTMIIRFGVLHLLGFAMMLYPLLKKLPNTALLPLGMIIVALGLWFELRPVLVSVKFLFPLGLCYKGFTSGDFFPILPHLGWFCLGIALGRTLYPTKQTLLPRVNAAAPILRFFCWCGRNSLYIFILHLPLLGGLLMLIL